MKCPVHHRKKFLWLIILHLCVDVHSCFAIFMSGKVLNRLRVNTGIQQVGDIGMAQQMWRHMEIQCILNLGVVFLCHPQRRCDSILNALPIYIFIIVARLGRANHHILPYPLKLRRG